MLKIFLVITTISDGGISSVHKEIGPVSAKNIETCNQMKRQMEFTYFPPEGMSFLFCTTKKEE